MANLLTTIAAEFDILTQTNFLNRQIRDAVQPEYVWRAQASSDMEVYPNKIGIPEIISVRGLRAPNTATNNVSNSTDPNAGISFSGITYEQFKIQVDRYDGGDVVDMFARNLPIADKFLETYITLAQGAASSQDFIARNVLYTAYTGGSTTVTANSGASTTLWVDNINGFQPYTGAQGEVATANVTVGANTYVLASVVANSTHGASVFASTDGTIVGTPGFLTFTTTVAAADQAVNGKVAAVNAPHIFYANSIGAVNPTLLTVAAAGHTMLMSDVQKMKNSLTNNRMKNPTLHATPDALFGLYQDPNFQLLYRGAYGSDTYKTGEVGKLLGVSIVEVTSAPIFTVNATTVHASIMTTDGCLTEARMTETMASPEVDGPVHTVIENNIAMKTTAPIDPAGQFTRIVYLQFVGYACRTDRGITPAVVPTASASNLKRAAVLFSTAS
jgi:hypothetical protein